MGVIEGDARSLDWTHMRPLGTLSIQPGLTGVVREVEGSVCREHRVYRA